MYDDKSEAVVHGGEWLDDGWQGDADHDWCLVGQSDGLTPRPLAFSFTAEEIAAYLARPETHCPITHVGGDRA
jgi:hypothetical protein